MDEFILDNRFMIFYTAIFLWLVVIGFALYFKRHLKIEKALYDSYQEEVDKLRDLLEANNINAPTETSVFKIKKKF